MGRVVLWCKELSDFDVTRMFQPKSAFTPEIHKWHGVLSNLTAILFFFFYHTSCRRNNWIWQLNWARAASAEKAHWAGDVRPRYEVAGTAKGHCSSKCWTTDQERSVLLWFFSLLCYAAYRGETAKSYGTGIGIVKHRGAPYMNHFNYRAGRIWSHSAISTDCF